jgi:hypothetical protein
MPRSGRCRDAHWRILHRFAGRVQDGAPEAPPCPRPPIDPDYSARLRIAHALRDQPNEPILLLRTRMTRMRRTGPPHHNLRLLSDVATFAGICLTTHRTHPSGMITTPGGANIHANDGTSGAKSG